MYPIYFKAVLKTEDDKLLEQGYACINMETKSVDFKSDFIPLLKMGTTVKIIQVAGDTEMRKFVGEVYLSSQKLLRIVSVSDSVLRDAEKIFAVNCSIDAQVSPVVVTTGRRPHKKELWHHANIYSISSGKLKFTSAEQYRTGQRLNMQTEKPIQLRKMVVEVYQAIVFGETVTGHLCNIITIQEPWQTALTEYLDELSRSGNGLFSKEI